MIITVPVANKTLKTRVKKATNKTVPVPVRCTEFYLKTQNVIGTP